MLMIFPRVNWTIRLGRALHTLGPYAAIELVVPGGSLIVLSLWAIRHRSWLAAYARRAFARRDSSPAPPGL
jgi:hypothetical protein